MLLLEVTVGRGGVGPGALPPEAIGSASSICGLLAPSSKVVVLGRAEGATVPELGDREG